jgi:DNA-directed RNA polymerase III subunit RPC8
LQETDPHSDPATQQFVWQVEGGVLHFDKHEAVRFQIDEEHWFDQTPVGPSELEEDVKKSPYTLTASMQGDGLGPCLWWDDNAVAEE